jgi:hypothetical protein
MAGAGETRDEANDPSYDFIERSHLTYVVPSRTNIDLEKAFENVDASRPILESIQQRATLFFGKNRPHGIPPLGSRVRSPTCPPSR